MDDIRDRLFKPSKRCDCWLIIIGFHNKLSIIDFKRALDHKKCP